MNKEIKLAEITNGKMTDTINVSAWYYETRHSWGHKAEVYGKDGVIATAKIVYLNRTWESYRYQSVIHSALFNYVIAVTGINPIKGICKRDTKPMKSAAAEARRLERVAAHDFAVALYKNLKAEVDGVYAVKAA